MNIGWVLTHFAFLLKVSILFKNDLLASLVQLLSGVSPFPRLEAGASLATEISPSP